MQSADCMVRSLQTAWSPCRLKTTLYLLACFARISYRFTCFTRTTCTCVLWRDNFTELSWFYSVVLCEKLGGHFGSRESSSSQQPFIPCEQTCHCFPQLQARKRMITLVKKNSHWNGPRAVCRLHGMQSADCTATVQSADCTVQSADCARFPDCMEHGQQTNQQTHISLL